MKTLKRPIYFSRFPKCINTGTGQIFTVLTWVEANTGIWSSLPDNILIHNMLAIVQRAGRRRRHWNLSGTPDIFFTSTYWRLSGMQGQTPAPNKNYLLIYLLDYMIYG